MGIHSDWVRVNESALIEASAWIRAKDIVPCGTPAIEGCRNWHNFRITLTAFDANNEKVKPRGHWDIVSTGGDICGPGEGAECGWVRLRSSLVTPPGTAKMRMEIKFTSSTGVAWVDDVELREVMSMPATSAQIQNAPAIYPEPALKSLRGEPRPWGGAVLASVGHAQDPRLVEQLKSSFPLVSFDPDVVDGARRIVIGGHAHPGVDDMRKQRFPDRDWAELGVEGYFIAYLDGEDQQTVYIGSNTAHGSFHALQTLRQLFVKGMMQPVDLWDYPEVSRRGMAMGLHWFREGGTGRHAIERLVERKGNMIWNQGAYMGGKFSFGWREPFTTAELRVMKQYLDLASDHFIDVHLSFGPRTRFTAEGCTQVDRYPTPVFSSRKEIEVLVAKIRALYELGFRNFGLNFDDLEHCGEDVLRHQSDIETFSGDIGSAHAYFANEVFARLMSIDTDIGFMVIPLWYSSAGNYVGTTANHKRDYLLRMKELDPRIELHSVQIFGEDFAAIQELTGRPTFLWTNYFSMNKDTDYTLPWVSFFPWDDEKVTGFLFLPAPPDLPATRREDSSRVSWDSALGYAWAPSRYDPVASFNRSVGRFRASGADGPRSQGTAMPRH